MSEQSIVEVRLWGTTIGHLGYKPGQTEVASFEYAEQFSQSGIQISPLQMPAPTRNHSFPDISQRTFKGVPGIFADSLPDKFGNQLIDLFMAEKKVASEDVTTLDRLLYIGERGMGALEYRPSASFNDTGTDDLALDIHTLAELASCVISKDETKREHLLDIENRTQALKLIRVGSSAGGARSKALVAIAPNGDFKDGTKDHGIDHRYYLLKFDSENNQDRDHTDPKGMTRVEYIYSLIAHECEIDLPHTDFIKDGEDFHFLIERFDRVVHDGKLEKRHYASWSGINHAHRDTTGTYSYEQLVMTARSLKLGQSALTEIFKRAAFNVVGRNQDDHTKNFGFLMDKRGQWTLAPAFDLTYAYDPDGKWTRGHQIRLAGKQGNFTRQDLELFGEYCNLKSKRIGEIIDNTLDAFSEFKSLATRWGVSEQLKMTILKNLRAKL